MESKRIYLAHLYSLGAFHKENTQPFIDEELLEKRFEHCNLVAAKIMETFGHIVFSPISHSHPIQKYCDPKSWAHRFWLKQDKPYLEWCDELWIALDGTDLYDWRRSIGVRWEKYLTYLMRKPAKEVWYDKVSDRFHFNNV